MGLRKIKKIKPIRKKYKKRLITKKDITVSKAEMVFLKFLKEIGLSVEEQFQIAYKFYDFRIRSTKLIIEFHGSYWHGSDELYESKDLNAIQKRCIINDKYKKTLAEANGYKIIYVWEHHFNKDKVEVKNKLLKEVGEYYKKKTSNI